MKAFKAFIFLAVFLLPALLQAQNLIPKPKEIIRKEGFFNLNVKLKIEPAKGSEENAAFLQNHLNVPESVSNSTKKKATISLEQISRPDELAKRAEKNGAASGFDFGTEGYLLNVGKDKIEILAPTQTGIFYGIQTLRQLLNAFRESKKIPCMVICDKPDIAIRAWQDDISRGPIPTLDMLKKAVEIMAAFKLNYFTLYTEHVFKLDKHPTIAPADGITKADIRELSAFAERHHVTLIGNYQSFGHMEETLSNPKYSYLAENEHIISPAMEESYDFLADVYSEIVPQYDGDFFNINCDETFGLGEGKSKAMVDSMGIAGVYAYHINRLDKILKKYNKKILMWGDIATSHPEIISRLPRDMTVIVWGYHPAPDFDYAIEPIAREKLNFWVAPGVSCWSNMYPDRASAEVNIYNMIRDGYKLGASGVLNTSWDDDGLNFFNDTWHGFAWAAENCWNAPPDLSQTDSEAERKRRFAEFNAAFDIQFYGLPPDTDALQPEGKSITRLTNEFAAFHDSEVQKLLKNTRFFEGVFPIYLDYVRDEMKDKNLSALSRLDSILLNINNLKPDIARHEATIDYLTFAIDQARFVLKKNLFRIGLYAWLNGKAPGKKSVLEAENTALIADAKELKQNYIRLWHRENRPYWLDVNTAKFDRLINSLETLGNYVLIEPLNEVSAAGRKISMRTVFNNSPIYYSLNADTVTTGSGVYNAPFFVKKDVRIQAFSPEKNHPTSVQKKDLIYHKAIGKLYRLNSTYSSYNPSYDGGGRSGLVDGQTGSAANLKSGRWQGYSGQDIDLELAFSGKDILHSFAMGFFQNTGLWVIFPPRVDIYIKDNQDDEYRLFKTIRGTIPPEANGNIKEVYKTGLDGITPKYLKIVARNYGNLPDWHTAGSGYASMIFSDEVVVK